MKGVLIMNLLASLTAIWKILGILLTLLILTEILIQFIDRVFFKSVGGYINSKLALCDMKLCCENHFFDEHSDKKYKIEAAKAFANRHWWPFVYWKLGAFKGDFININKEGHRETWQSMSSTSLPKKQCEIFTFGGSTMWGWGANDIHTIPSLIGKKLNGNKDMEFTITNFGQPGYVCMQDIITLIQALQSGKKPNFVIFYHGINDVFSALQNGRAGFSQNEPNRKQQFEKNNSWHALLTIIDSLKITKTIKYHLSKKQHLADVYKELCNARKDATIQSLIKHYGGSIKIINALAHEHHFEAFIYWQPTLSTKSLRSETEKCFTISAFDKECYESATTAIKESLKSNNNFRDISNLFSSEKSTIFVDPWHSNQQGNLKVAETISNDILASLDRNA
jgi:lysophospholipase L1-like esterase